MRVKSPSELEECLASHQVKAKAYEPLDGFGIPPALSRPAAASGTPKAEATATIADHEQLHLE